MRKLITFNFVTLNSFYKGPAEDTGWHKHGAEEAKYSEESLKPGNTLLFGRVTYEMMANFWPTPMAAKNFPIVAEGMNKAKKIVFSKTLKKPAWQNTKVIKGNIVEEIKKMKKLPGKNMTILGSGSIVTQLAKQNLIDEYQMMIDPVAIGKGTPLFKGINDQLDLKLTHSRIFKSGVVLLCYEPR